MKPPMIYPGKARVRRHDAETSHLAADSNDIARSSQAVLDLLDWHGPSADHELFALAQQGVDYSMYTPQRLRTARAELVESGHVEFAGYYHSTPSGRKTQVWQLTEKDPK